MTTAKLQLDRMTWIVNNERLEKCSTIQDAAEYIKSFDNVEIKFRPYNEEEKEIKKYMKRIIRISSISGHSYSEPKNQIIKGYVTSTMIVALKKEK